jgi:hypothetical protein
MLVQAFLGFWDVCFTGFAGIQGVTMAATRGEKQSINFVTGDSGG